MEDKKRYLVTFTDPRISPKEVGRVLGVPTERVLCSSSTRTLSSEREEVLLIEQFGIAMVDVDEQTATQYAKLNEIDTIELDAETKIADNETDYTAPSGQNAYASSSNIPWNILQVGVKNVWMKKQLFGNGVKLAILDTGIAPHLGLKITGGAYFATGDTNYEDKNGHGTFCAGIAAGIGSQGPKGYVIGVAPRCSLYAVKIMKDNGIGNDGWAIQGLDWCKSNNINVASMSISGLENPSSAYARAISECQKAGMTVVCAAGNFYIDKVRKFPWVTRPANSVEQGNPYAAPIAVGAVDCNRVIADFSSRGTKDGILWNPITVVAPGVDIYSTQLNQSYIISSGTSTSCPHVTGAVVLLYQANPKITAQEVKQRIQRAIPLGDPIAYGAGLINCMRAVL